MSASFDFDAVHRRAGTDSTKWRRYGDGVLPLWVADMDFPVAPVIRAAMHRRLEHPFLGYCEPADGLKDAIRAELRERYGWSVAPEAIVFVTGVVPGFNLALKALVAPGGAIVIHTPVYPPILGAAANFGLERRDVPLERQADGTRAFDPDRLRTALAGAGALLLCHPHNPVGKVFSRAELAVIGTAALEAGAVILSDEIHCGLVFDGRGHVPMATLSPEIARRTVTLMSAGKNYNIPGLKTAFAVIEDEGLRKRFEGARAGLADVGNMLGYAATEAAYAHGRPWLDAAMAYLTRQRDWLIPTLRERLPGVAVDAPQATYLAWLDCTGLGLGEEGHDFFLREARVALNRGRDFGPGGAPFVRLNFGCPRATLVEAIDRMADALARR